MIVLGIMSGTSLDGIDFALVSLEYQDEEIDFNLLHSATIPYAKFWYEALKEAHFLREDELKTLSQRYGKYLADTTRAFLETTTIHPDLIASHGHTVLHQPDKGIALQIGNGPELFKQLNIPVVCDFRVQDVKLGGQGAPLVPIGDRFLFFEYDCCINLGGFINLSFEHGDGRVAYDVCPMNIVMNDLSVKCGMNYDSGGELARQGTQHTHVLEELNALKYYSEHPPKSLGKEWVLEYIWPLLAGIDPKDALRTWVEHSAQQLAKNINGKAKVLLTGGGVYNLFFLERLRVHSNSELIIPKKEIVDFKEAVIFALLGFLKWHDKINVLSSVTGAKHDHSSGIIYGHR